VWYETPMPKGCLHVAGLASLLVQAACGARFGSATDANGRDAPPTSTPAPTGSPAASSNPSGAFAYYFIDTRVASGAIKAVPAGGGSPTLLFQGNANRGSLAGLAFDSQGVYFALEHRTTVDSGGTSVRSSSLHTMPPGGGAVTVLATGLDFVERLARSGAYLYFVVQSVQSPPDSGPGTGNPSASIERIPLAGGAVEVLATVPKVVHGIVEDSSFVYWTQSNPLGVSGPVIGEVMRMPLAGGPPEILAQGQHLPFAIALDSSRLYWMDQGGDGSNPACSATDGTVMTLDAATGLPVALASGLVEVDSISARGGDVYWSILGGPCMMALGSVFQRNGATGSIRTRATPLIPGNVYVDATTLYFTSVTGDPNNPVTAVTALPR
jgi:hypothetical protein